MKDLKHSRQREALLENLKNRTDHPTADMLYCSIREDYPHVSLGTVYRNLALLCEAGTIRRISCGDGVERYDYTTADHYHFVCRDCGRVLDLPPAENGSPEQFIHSGFAGRVDSHSLIFYGSCGECLHKK